MNRKQLKERGKWAVCLGEGLVLVLAYFGAFGVLMYPVLDAAGYVA
jgi:hypothetical protein